MKGILGYKRGMARIFDATGRYVPVTVIEAGPCVVTQVKTEARDGYNAVQLAFAEVKAERISSGERGHLAKSRSAPRRHLREFRGEAAELKLGSTVDAGMFAAGDKVHVTATSRGLGTAGTVKRHHFHRQRKTHGQSDRERAPGSVGAGSTPGKTIKGLRMSGRMGNERVTVRNLSIVVADPKRNLLAVRGAVPGARGSLVIIREASK